MSNERENGDVVNVLLDIKDLLGDIRSDVSEINQGIGMILDNHMKYPTTGNIEELRSLVSDIEKGLSMIEMKD